MSEGQGQEMRTPSADRTPSGTATVTADEFIRRFLLHVLPDSFMKIRYFGFLANRCKKDSLQCSRQLCGHSPDLPQKVRKSVEQLMEELTGSDMTQCPLCKKGTLKYYKTLPKAEEIVNSYSEPHLCDSS